MSGRGSVKKDASGRWMYVVDVTPKGVTPRKQARKRNFPTKAAAQAALTELLNSLATQTYVEPSRQRLGDFLTKQWLPNVEPTLRPSTFSSYSRNIRLHVEAMPIGSRPLQDVTPLDLNRLYRSLQAGDDDRKPLSVTSTRYIATILHRAFRDAVKWQLLIRNPADSADPPAPKAAQEMKVWDGSQVAAFLAAADDDRYSGAWWLLATTGMRRGEALGLRWSDVDLDAAVLNIRQTLVLTGVRRADDPGFGFGEPKTAKGKRTVALDTATVAALRRHRARQVAERVALGAGYKDQDLVVALPTGTPIHPKTFSSQFDAIVKAAGLPRIRLHDLRHSHATLALRAGVPARVVQERLGHANVSITLDTYSHVSVELQAEAAAKVAALVTGGTA